MNFPTTSTGHSLIVKCGPCCVGLEYQAQLTSIQPKTPVKVRGVDGCTTCPSTVVDEAYGSILCSECWSTYVNMYVCIIPTLTID